MVQDMTVEYGTRYDRYNMVQDMTGRIWYKILQQNMVQHMTVEYGTRYDSRIWYKIWQVEYGTRYDRYNMVQDMTGTIWYKIWQVEYGTRYDR